MWVGVQRGPEARVHLSAAMKQQNVKQSVTRDVLPADKWCDVTDVLIGSGGLALIRGKTLGGDLWGAGGPVPEMRRRDEELKQE